MLSLDSILELKDLACPLFTLAKMTKTIIIINFIDIVTPQSNMPSI